MADSSQPELDPSLLALPLGAADERSRLSFLRALVTSVAAYLKLGPADSNVIAMDQVLPVFTYLISFRSLQFRSRSQSSHQPYRNFCYNFPHCFFFTSPSSGTSKLFGSLVPSLDALLEQKNILTNLELLDLQISFGYLKLGRKI
jgi:hypothetical protein